MESVRQTRLENVISWARQTYAKEVVDEALQLIQKMKQPSVNSLYKALDSVQARTDRRGVSYVASFDSD